MTKTKSRASTEAPARPSFSAEPPNVGESPQSPRKDKPAAGGRGRGRHQRRGAREVAGDDARSALASAGAAANRDTAKAKSGRLFGMDFGAVVEAHRLVGER